MDVVSYGKGRLSGIINYGLTFFYRHFRYSGGCRDNVGMLQIMAYILSLYQLWEKKAKLVWPCGYSRR